jgi:2-methoxy-6-polyprenyl-1,4-benzoquinol methylase
MLSKTFVRFTSRGGLALRAFSTDQKIDFGYKEVNRDDKEKLVGKVFSSVAESYDLMNDAMSFGIHRCWKDQFVGMTGPMRMRKVTDEKGAVIGDEPLKILDVAGGTGDISFRMHEKAKSEATAGSKESPCNDII